MGSASLVKICRLVFADRGRITGHPEVIHLAAIADRGNGTAAILGIALTLGEANVTLAVRFRNACAPST